VFIVLFVTGEPKATDTKSDSSLQNLSILNVTDAPFKVILCYFNTMITIIAMTMYMLIKYIMKFNDKLNENEVDPNGPKIYDLR